MMWRALSRLVAVRLLLLVAIAAAGPAGVASSWHASNSLEHRLAVQGASTQPAALTAGALPPDAAVHCVACQFGSTLRAWAPTAAPASLVPLATDAHLLAPRPAALRTLPSGVNAGRAPPAAA